MRDTKDAEGKVPEDRARSWPPDLIIRDFVQTVGHRNFNCRATI